MNREKWYQVVHNLSSTTYIDGIRIIDAVALAGDIVPGIWFQDVPDSNFFDVILHGRNAIKPITPDEDEYPYLYTLYPAMLPEGVKLQAFERVYKKWYRVNTYKRGSLAAGAYNGLTALSDIDGVCQASDVAQVGDIIPSQWFGGLKPSDITKLLIKHCIEPYTPDPLELRVLQEKYPGTNKKVSVKKPSKKKTTKKEDVEEKS